MYSGLDFEAQFGDVISEEAEWMNQYFSHYPPCIKPEPTFTRGSASDHPAPTGPAFENTLGAAQPLQPTHETLAEAVDYQEPVPEELSNKNDPVSDSFPRTSAAINPANNHIAARMQSWSGCQYPCADGAVGSPQDPNDHIQYSSTLPYSSRPSTSVLLSESFGSPSDGASTEVVSKLSGDLTQPDSQIHVEGDISAREQFKPVVNRQGPRRSLLKAPRPPRAHKDQLRRGAKSKAKPSENATTAKEPLSLKSSRLDAKARTDRIDFVVNCRRRGMTYKEIKAAGKLPEAESTLRGQYRNLIKSKEQRIRRPAWTDRDVSSSSFAL